MQKILIEVTLDQDNDLGDFKRPPHVVSVKVDGEEVKSQDGTVGRSAETFWDLRDEDLDDGMSLVISQSYY